jgi:hypothetical protein
LDVRSVVGPSDSTEEAFSGTFTGPDAAFARVEMWACTPLETARRMRAVKARMARGNARKEGQAKEAKGVDGPTDDGRGLVVDAQRWVYALYIYGECTAR